MRRTIATAVQFRGIGLHSGRLVSLAVLPAASGTGILFQRIGSGAGTQPLRARYDQVSGTLRSTCLSNGDGVAARTVEHLMAAFAGTGVTDALVSLDGPEVPILDGSALPFVQGFAAAGFTALAGSAPAIRILRPVEVALDGRRAALTPAPCFQIDFTVDFADPAIGTQRKVLDLTGGAFAAELCDARTFGMLSEVESLRRQGLGRGGSLENTVVIDQGRVLNPGGLRHPDEFVRHKMLDAVGDLALAGAPIIGRYTGYRSGHTLTNMLLRALFARTDAWTWTEALPHQVPGGAAALVAEPATRPPMAV